MLEHTFSSSNMSLKMVDVVIVVVLFSCVFLFYELNLLMIRGKILKPLLPCKGIAIHLPD